MTDARAIETEYNGILFRSRLEARWAVFFDAIKLKYEYEPEGFELSDGTRYLPDFYLPDDRIYVEIKGNRPEAVTSIDRASRFVGRGIDRLLLLSDIPTGQHVWFFDCVWMHPLSEELMASRVFFDFLEDEERGFVCRDYYDPFRDTYGSHIFGFGMNEVQNQRLCTKHLTPVHETLKDDEVGFEDNKSFYTAQYVIPKAFDIARSARFEFGETPVAEAIV